MTFVNLCSILFFLNKINKSFYTMTVTNCASEIAIIGGGMSGLMTSILLQSVGIENWEIMESSQRVGGYVNLGNV